MADNQFDPIAQAAGDHPLSGRTDGQSSGSHAPPLDLTSPTPSPPVVDAAKAVPLITIDDLPSRFLPYPSGSSIKYQPYTYGEVLDLNQPGQKNWQKFESMLGGIIIKGFDAHDLTLMDFMYIGVARRVSTLDVTEFRALFPCKNEDCKEPNKTVLNATQLEFDYIKAPQVPLVLGRMAGYNDLAFKPITVGQMLELWASGDDSPAHMMAKQLVGQVVQQGDQKVIIPVDQKVIFQAIYNAMDEDARNLRRVDDYLFHGLKPIPVNCSKCGHSFHLLLDSWEAVLLPFRESEESDDDIISFGLAGDS